MRIDYLSSSVLPSRSANSLHVMKMCGALARAGHQVTLFGTAAGSETDDEVFGFYGVRQTFQLQRSRIGSLPLATRLVSVKAGWRSRGADVVLSRNLVAAQAACLAGARVIYEAHSPISENPIARQMFSWLASRRKFLCLVVITHALKAWFVQHYPWLADKIVVLPDAADPVPANTVAMPLAGAGGRLQVGYVGHLYDGKGMEVVSALPALCTWADFSIVGGMDHDVKRWSESLIGYPNIRFFGHRSHAETARFLAAFDVVLLPNQRVVRSVKVERSGRQQLDIAAWTSPLKMFEYMAAGKAIISSDLPVLQEVLRHNVNALLCPPDQPEAWAESLLRVAKDPALRESLGESANRDFLQSYTWDTRATKLTDKLQ